MTDTCRNSPLTAEEIESRFRFPAIRMSRPVLWTGIRALRMVRGFGWQSRFDCDLKSLSAPLVFASNHRSHVDTPAILGTLPREIRQRTTVAAALDVFGPDNNNGLKRWVSKECLQFLVASGFHAFAFDRFGPPLRSIRTSVQLIRNGWNLVLYPEGTRSRTRQMGPFKAGVGVLARFTESPVIPVFVEGGGDVLPYGAFMPGPGKVYVRYGEPLWYENSDTPESFTERLQLSIRRLENRQARACAKLAYMHDVRTVRRLRRQPA